MPYSERELIIEKSTFTITRVRSQDDLTATCNLFMTYAESLGIDLTFQTFSTEMAEMPGKYALPWGELLLARSELNGGVAMGCVGLRPLFLSSPSRQDNNNDNGEEWNVCEMKRLYVAPSGRGLGLGTTLLNICLEIAVELGYHEIRLDTLSTMTSAIRLYEGAGFERIPRYYDTPLQDTVFLGKKLERKPDIKEPEG